MNDIKVTIASLRSILIDPKKNLELVRNACIKAQKDGARLLLLPELMLTGHGGHPKMIEAAEEIPNGSLSKAVLSMSREYSLCICVGLAELSDNTVYNSQMVADKGKYLGLQRKLNLSSDENIYFGPGESIEVFDIGDIRFGISICYDNNFPELALIHNLNNVDLILAPHACRLWDKPQEHTPEFCSKMIKLQQELWGKIHTARAFDNNAFVLLCNAVGSSVEGLEGVVANHAGTIMGVYPDGEIFLRTSKTDFSDEIVTVELKKNKREVNHATTLNRRLGTVINLLQSKSLTN